MKTSTVVTRAVHAACAVGAAWCAPAWTQSTVTIYGIVDVSVRNVRTEGIGSVTGVASGGASASRLGFRGTEDLGSGLSAGFNLEHGFNADTGTAAGGTVFFDRRATVSLVSKSLGELRLGRDYIPSYMAWMRFDPFLYSNVAGSASLISGSATGASTGPIRAAFGPPTGAANPNTAVRSDNAVQYHLPGSLLRGLDGQVMVAPGEGAAASTGAGKLFGARLGYSAGPLYLAASRTQTENSLTAGDSFKDSVLGASYAFDNVTLGAAWRQFKFRSAKQANLLLSAVVPVGAAGQIKGAWQRADMDGTVGATNVGSNGATQLSLGYAHNLSKRTTLYVQAARIDNKGASTFVMPGGNTTGFVGGRSATGFETGIRHTF